MTAIRGDFVSAFRDLLRDATESECTVMLILLTREQDDFPMTDEVAAFLLEERDA